MLLVDLVISEVALRLDRMENGLQKRRAVGNQLVGQPHQSPENLLLGLRNRLDQEEVLQKLENHDLVILAITFHFTPLQNSVVSLPYQSPVGHARDLHLLRIKSKVQQKQNGVLGNYVRVEAAVKPENDVDDSMVVFL